VTPYVIGVSWGGANWAEILTGFGTLVIGLGAFAAAYGAMAAARQLRESEKARHIALAVEMSRRWDSPALVTLRRSLRGITPSAFLQRYETARQANSQDFYNLQLLANFFEDLGALVKVTVQVPPGSQAFPSNMRRSPSKTSTSCLRMVEM
jgi:pimeloyl-ACP methyl ester carboxylesterase